MSDAAELRDVLDRLRNRFFGKFRGAVTQVDATTWSIKAQVPAVLGTQESGWCQPCVPYAGPGAGFLMLPDIGAGVWVEFEGGDVSRPIWVGCFWRQGELPATADATVKSVVTSAGTLAFDTGALSLTLAGQQDQTVVLDDQGITLGAGAGTVVVGQGGVDVNSGALTVS